MKDKYLYKRLGERITNERKEQNISQEQLAFRSHMDRTYLARIEEGKANPSIRILSRISKTLNIPVCRLLSNIDDY
jgi:transcriptional regulator with XRE-family HTH domain